MEQTVDTSKISIRPIAKSAAREMIVKNHYSKRFSSCRYALGIYHTSDKNKFFTGDNETLIGCLIYGHPVCNRAVNSILKEGGLSLDSVLELTRLFVHDGYGKNIESHAIGLSFYWIRKNDPKVKVLISYADPEQGHLGRIYQATNWLYQGCGVSKLMPDYSVKETPTADWTHSRTVGSRWGSKNIQKLSETIGHRFWRREESAKHRYIYLLCSKTEKKKILRNIKLPILSYPKGEDMRKMPIQQIDLVNGKAVVTLVDESAIQ